MLPWNLLKSSNSFTSYLSAYSVFLSSIAGVMVCVHITSELVNQGSYYSPRLPNTMLLDEATTTLQICMTLTRMVGIGTLTGSTSAHMLPTSRAFSSTLSVLLVPVRPLQQDGAITQPLTCPCSWSNCSPRSHPNLPDVLLHRIHCLEPHLLPPERSVPSTRCF